MKKSLKPLLTKKKKRKKKKKKKESQKRRLLSQGPFSLYVSSAYASGALVKCRKVGAKNWGNKSKKKNEGLYEEEESPTQGSNGFGFRRWCRCWKNQEKVELTGLSEKEVKDVIAQNKDIVIHKAGDVIELSGLPGEGRGKSWL